jgi:hypothetical protein
MKLPPKDLRGRSQVEDVRHGPARRCSSDRSDRAQPGQSIDSKQQPTEPEGMGESPISAWPIPPSTPYRPVRSVAGDQTFCHPRRYPVSADIYARLLAQATSGSAAMTTFGWAKRMPCSK